MDLDHVHCHEEVAQRLLDLHGTVCELVLTCREARDSLSDPQEREYAHKLHEAMLHVDKNVFQLGRDVRKARTVDDRLLAVYATVCDLVQNCIEARDSLGDPQEREYAHKLHEVMLHVKKTVFQLGRDIAHACDALPDCRLRNCVGFLASATQLTSRWCSVTPVRARPGSGTEAHCTACLRTSRAQIAHSKRAPRLPPPHLRRLPRITDAADPRRHPGARANRLLHTGPGHRMPSRVARSDRPFDARSPTSASAPASASSHQRRSLTRTRALVSRISHACECPMRKSHPRERFRLRRLRISVPLGAIPASPPSHLRLRISAFASPRLASPRLRKRFRPRRFASPRLRSAPSPASLCLL
ncbi:MAG: hypothetical protein SGPRY_001158, partial [Prymnesium sp.]